MRKIIIILTLLSLVFISSCGAADTEIWHGNSIMSNLTEHKPTNAEVDSLLGEAVVLKDVISLLGGAHLTSTASYFYNLRLRWYTEEGALVEFVSTDHRAPENGDALLEYESMNAFEKHMNYTWGIVHYLDDLETQTVNQ